MQWNYCPECGCEEITDKDFLGEGSRSCKKCKQEWWIDIDYTATVMLNLQRLSFAPPSNDIATDHLTPEIIIEALRNSYAKEKGDTTIEAVWQYVSFLENKIVDYRLLTPPVKVDEGKAECSREVIEYLARVQSGERPDSDYISHLLNKVERLFTEMEISQLQSEVYKITGKGDVMVLFNKLLGVNAG